MNTVEKVAPNAEYSINNHEEHDHSDTLLQRTLAYISKLDFEFPLSGGETNEEFTKNIEYLDYRESMFVKDVDVHFPLSGAE